MSTLYPQTNVRMRYDITTITQTSWLYECVATIAENMQNNYQDTLRSGLRLATIYRLVIILAQTRDSVTWA